MKGTVHLPQGLTLEPSTQPHTTKHPRTTMAFKAQTGGRRPSTHRPDESELVALGCAYAMMFCFCGGDMVRSHCEKLAAEVKRVGGSTQVWAPDEVSTHMRPHELACHMHMRARCTCTCTKKR